MAAEKKMLSLDELESQAAVELPDRELMATVNIGGGLINVQTGNINVDVDVVNNTICVNVAAINSQAFC